MVDDALAKLCEAPMPGPSETLVDLEQRVTEHLLDFERLDAAWPKGRIVTNMRSYEATIASQASNETSLTWVGDELCPTQPVPCPNS